MNNVKDRKFNSMFTRTNFHIAENIGNLHTCFLWPFLRYELCYLNIIFGVANSLTINNQYAYIHLILHKLSFWFMDW